MRRSVITLPMWGAGLAAVVMVGVAVAKPMYWSEIPYGLGLVAIALFLGMLALKELDR